MSALLYEFGAVTKFFGFTPEHVDATPQREQDCLVLVSTNQVLKLFDRDGD